MPPVLQPVATGRHSPSLAFTKEKSMAFRKSMFLFLSAALLIAPTFAGYAQTKAMNSITADDLRMHLNMVAGSETEGRNTPSTGVNIISRYLATMAERYGLKSLMPNGSYYQNIPLEITAVSESKSRLRVISPIGEELYYGPQSFGGNLSMSGAWGGEVVFVGYGLSAPDKGWDDYGNMNLAGKIVIMLEGQLPEGHALRAEMARPAARAVFPRTKGASLVLSVVSPERERDLLACNAGFQLAPRPRMPSLYPTQQNQARPSDVSRQSRPQQPPAVNVLPQTPRTTPAPGQVLLEIRHEVAASVLGITGSELDAMFASIAGGQPVPRREMNKRIELSIVTEKRVDSSPNVLAVLEGSDPILKSEYVVISSHHDHLGMRNGKPLDGADDDGSGTVGMLEIAQALAIERPKRSVILAWFTGEEQGLLGSHYFVNNCPVPLEKISANLNLDMISRNDADSLFLIASNNLSTELDGAIRSQNDKYSKLKFDYVYNDRAHPDNFYHRSDQYPFVRVGIPGVWLFCGTTPDYHTVRDTIERVDFGKMEKVTRLTYLVTLEIGNKPELLKLDANPEVKTRGKHNISVESIR
jgi:hypothetical protein